VNAERAQEIYQSKDTIPVQLDSGQSVWIEKVDRENGVATVQVGSNPGNTETVNVERLREVH
jgi:small acid-soluble spore protein H (minor)